MSCRDCRWFGVSHMRYVSPKAPDDWQACTLVNSQDGQREQPRASAMAIDGEGLSAELLVSPDHGCVQFEARP